MQDLDHIDDFFSGKLSAGEQTILEKRLIDDPGFAAQAAFYASVLQAAKEQAEEDKKKRFRMLYEQRGQLYSVKKEQRIPVRKLWRTVVAAAAVVAAISIGIYYFTKHGSPQGLAKQYEQTELHNLGVQMSGVQDSLQRDLHLYNDGRLQEALQGFEAIVQTDSGAIDAIKYAGLVSLRLKKYDQALAYFIRLANYPDLQSNPGKFYQALTLLLRNNSGDQTEAKRLLQEVVAQNLEEKETALQWLKAW